jgi:hypothetical protein
LHDDGTLRQWAELDYVPALPSETKKAKPRRYIGLRFLKPQGDSPVSGVSLPHPADRLISKQAFRAPPWRTA